MLKWFPRFQVATTCFSCSPPDLNLVVTNFMFYIHVKYPLPPGNNPIAAIIIIIIIIKTQLENSPLESSCVVVALIENYSTSQPLKKFFSFSQCHHMSFVDFVVLPPGHGRSVTDFWGWDAHEAQLRCPDGVWVVIEEYVVPGGALNLSLLIYPDHGHRGNLPLQGKFPR